MIDWQVFATIAAPIIALFVGAWVTRLFEYRPILLTHWGHVSSFDLSQENGTIVNTHSVVIRNVGRRAATNVRLSHSNLPSFSIFPPVRYKLEDVPNSGRDIVIPTIVPKQELIISYLYFPPITYTHVNAGVLCDEGFATHIPVLLQRQFPNWFNYTVLILFFVGISTLGYALFELGSLIVQILWSQA